jgi:hypothetical protein
MSVPVEERSIQNLKVDTRIDYPHSKLAKLARPIVETLMKCTSKVD